jgi:hypothetical protein
VEVEDVSEEAEEVGAEGEIAGPPANEELPAIADTGKETMGDHSDVAAKVFSEISAPSASNEHYQSTIGKPRSSSAETQTTLALHPQRPLPREKDAAQPDPNSSPSMPSLIPRDSRELSSVGGSLGRSETVSNTLEYSLPAFPF